MKKVDLLPFRYLQKRDTLLCGTTELSFSRTMAANIHPITGSDASHITAWWTLAHVRLSELSTSTHYRAARWVQRIMYLNPHENGLNIVGQQLPTVLDVTCCVRLHTLLHDVVCLGVVAQSLKPIKLLATCKRTQQLPTMLRPFARGFMVSSFLVFQATF